MNFIPQIKRTLCLLTPISVDIHKIMETLMHNGIKKITWIDNKTVTFDACNLYSPIYNAFLPKIILSLPNKKEPTVRITAYLRRSTQLFISLFWLVSLVFEILLFVLMQSDHSILTPVLLIPITLFLFSYALSYVGLLLSSKTFFRDIELAFNSTGDGSVVPSQEPK